MNQQEPWISLFKPSISLTQFYIDNEHLNFKIQKAKAHITDPEGNSSRTHHQGAINKTNFYKTIMKAFGISLKVVRMMVSIKVYGYRMHLG